MIAIQDLNLILSGFRLQNINLRIHPNDFFAVIGPTGSGKSLLLEAIVGLRPIQSGRIYINNEDLTHTPPERRKLGIVYQDYALFSHLSVRKNIEFGLQYNHIQPQTGKKRFENLVETMGLGHLLHRKPGTLSGGEQQRVALARVLIIKPRAVLLDEPLSALDPTYQDEMKDLLKTLHRDWGTTFLLVSHNFADVLYLANQGAIMHEGRIEQQGATQELFEKPNSPFTAQFVGMKNFFKATIHNQKAVLDHLELHLDSISENGNTYLGIRPEDILPVAAENHVQPNVFQGNLTKVVNKGFHFEIKLDVQGTRFTALWPKRTVLDLGIEPGASLQIAFPPECLHTF